MALRELKFRGIAESNGKWVYGNTIICDYDIHQMFICDTHAGYRRFDWEEVVNSTVGQFTGLHDKNGKEIYEGDVIKIVENYDTPYNAEVKFYKGVFGIENWTENTRNRCLTTLNHFMPTIGLYDDEQEYTVEVVGNIYDNKNLLEKGGQK